MTADPRLLAGLIPVPVTGIVAKCTINTANPIGSGTNTYIQKIITDQNPIKKKKSVRFQEKDKNVEWWILTGTWESLALLLGSVAEKTV